MSNAYQHLDVSKPGDVTVARLTTRRIIDEKDIEAVAQELFSLLVNGKCPKLVLNFSQVGYLSSAALGRLLILQKNARAHQSHIVLAELQPTIMEMFMVTRLNELFVITDSEADAIKSLQE